MKLAVTMKFAVTMKLAVTVKHFNICGIKFLPLDDNGILAQFNSGFYDIRQGSRSPKFGAEIRPHSQSQKVCFFPYSR